ncbi:MAG TPA: DUF3179 domain-containing (seleno)protein [Chitinophagaceae bacterium]
MKKYFYLGITGLILFEIANVFFIMPMPGSQELDSIELAYFLYSWRWAFRLLFGIMILTGLRSAFQSLKWLPALLLLIAGTVIYAANFKMAADHMFYQPSVMVMGTAENNIVDRERLVLGIHYNGEAKAYPIQYLGYHHQVRDSIGGKPVMVTYCTVCRTGRVFEPIVHGKTENFRLVGMDHYNAMFEDESTKSWWRQVTGESVAGKLKGEKLPEIASVQTTLGKWLELYPQSRIMQADPGFSKQYTSMSDYEQGSERGRLTRRDTGSWQPKSWVIGVIAGNKEKAYDWNRLQRENIIYDEINSIPVAIVLAQDKASFAAFERRSANQKFQINNDSLESNGIKYSFLGKSFYDSIPSLKNIPASQEYWHSWKTFHPNTLIDQQN